MKNDARTVQVSPLMGTERAFFEDRKEGLRANYEARVQQMVVEWEASSTKVAALRRKRFRNVNFVTFFGLISLRCHEGISKRGRRWKCPALAHFGIRPNQRYSPEAERRFGVLAAETGSYERASSVLDATWFAVSAGAVRSAVLRLGTAAKNSPPGEMRNAAAGPEDTLVVMADGWNARHRGANWGRDKANRNLPERVHWHEIRSAVVFKLSDLLAVSGKRKAIMDKHVVAVPADTSPHDFGLHLQREMERMGFRQAKAVFFVMDGGVWLWNIHKDRFKRCSKAMLDFYHLSQHLHALGAALHGADTTKTRAWCGRILHDLRHKSPQTLFRTLDSLLKEPPSDAPEVRKAIREQDAYFRKHAEHMDYAANAELGVPIGSGSVESLCSQFQNRLKRNGQFWTKIGFAALLRIIVRHWNGELDSLWMASAA